MNTRKVIAPNALLLSEVARVLADGQLATIRVKGSSMLPFIVGERDKVVLKREQRYVCGDVVLAEIQPGCFVLHRMIKIEGDNVVLMGDGNLVGTEKCSLDNIAGRVITIKTPCKEIACNTSWQRFLAKTWFYLRPLRRYLLAIYRRI